MLRVSEKKLQTVAAGASAALEEGRSLWADAWARLRKNRMAVAGGVFLAVLALCCIVLPPALGLSYEDQNLQVGSSAPFAELAVMTRPDRPSAHPELITVKRVTEDFGAGEADLARMRAGERVEIDGRVFTGSGKAFVFGTDMNGRDLLARVLLGGRISLMIGLVASLVALLIGVTWGAVAGYAGGKTDLVMMRIVDIMYALPFTIFVILLLVFLKEPMNDLDAWLRGFSVFGAHPFARLQGIGKIFVLFAAIGAVEWLTMARIVRGQVLSVKKMEYIEAARSLGYGPGRIIRRHIVPNVLGPVIVFTTLTIPAVILLESFLSFLGLGVDAPMCSWGTLIKDGAEKMEEFPWLLLFPGTIFSLTLLSLNFLGDGLRDALDVRASKD
ncbi:MAG: ABC transporter permease [Opitutaceae bacterium]|jgi:oligopeptide transport system permease protein|nr:ABC transporter permease [Opitutaceae bacterium]